MRSSLLTAAVLLLPLLAGCAKKATAHDITVREAQARFASNAATPCDANDDEYRTSAGWIPGAVRLTNFHTYAFSELPQDKAGALVFYCTSRH